MALSMNDFYGARPINPRVRHMNQAALMARIRPVAPDLRGMAGLRGLGALGKGGAAALGAAARARADQLISQGQGLAAALSSVNAAVKTADSVMTVAIATQDMDVQDQAQTLVDLSQDLVSRSSGLIQAFKSAADDFNAKYSAAERGQGFVDPSTADPLQSAVDAMKSVAADVQAFDTKANVVKSAVNRVAMKLKQQAAADAVRTAAENAAAQQAAQAAAQAAALQQAQLDRQAAAEERAYQLQLDREKAQQQREDAAEARRIAAEEAARQYEQQRYQDQLARQDALEAKQAAAEQAAVAAAAAREQAALDAQLRREAMEQERALREQEAQIRREEREAELQRLMTLQELAAKGVPGIYAPGPAVPAAALPTYTGMPYGPYPGTAMPPAQAPQQPAGPLPYSQTSSAPGQPGGALPEGMAWSTLDPGNELFGLGAMRANPSPQGSQIEEGFRLQRDPNHPGQFVIVDLANRRIAAGPLTADDLTQPQYDSVTNDPIYIPGVESGATGAAIATGIASAVTEAIRTTGSVISERDRLANDRRMARSGGGVPMSIPYDQGDRGGWGGWGGWVVVGILGLGGLALAASYRKKPANAKPAA